MKLVVTEAGALWEERPLPAVDETLRLDVGPLTLWVRSEENEIWLAWTRDEGEDASNRSLPDAPAWARWALPGGAHRIRFRPVFADRPLVVKPEHPFTLVKRASARIYVRIPVWVRVEAMVRGAKDPTLLTEIPTVSLSETWWGTFEDGELAYWLVTSGRRKVTDDIFRPHLVVSAIQLDNVSDEDLAVEKHILRTEHLSIYADQGHLWAEEVRIEYRGEDDGTEVHMEQRPPTEAAGAREISPARHQGRSFRSRTFARLRALSGWGA